MSTQGKCQLELDRERRIAENKRKMEELGVLDAAAALKNSKTPPVKRQKRAKQPTENVERRVSARQKKEVNYCELEPRAAKASKTPVDNTERIKGITLDEETAEKLRQEVADKRSAGKSGGKARGPVDSGKGVRIQGGRVYDSKHGVTCHWCRQKTLEEHVTCSNPNCGDGKRMPYSFCAKCLKNRHGEDCAAADASGAWVCPPCRGSCGKGCVTCCNCGPCRKRAELEPTAQVIFLARGSGFGNVHDYLVHLVTGEKAEAIANRKLDKPWGAWLRNGNGAGSSGTQTGTDKAGGCCSSGEHGHTHGPAADKVAALEDDAGKQDNQDQGPAAADGVKGHYRAAAKDRKTTKTASKGAAAAAAGPSKVVEEESEEEEEADDVPMLSTEDMRLPRKLRIMQKLGLAPVTVVTN